MRRLIQANVSQKISFLHINAKNVWIIINFDHIFLIFRELILNCCTEFIHLVSSEANDICNNQQKKTINAEHVLIGISKAVKRLGTI